MTKQQTLFIVLGALWTGVAVMTFINYSEALASSYILVPITLLIGIDIFSSNDVTQKGSL